MLVFHLTLLVLFVSLSSTLRRSIIFLLTERKMIHLVCMVQIMKTTEEDVGYDLTYLPYLSSLVISFLSTVFIQ